MSTIQATEKQSTSMCYTRLYFNHVSGKNIKVSSEEDIWRGRQLWYFTTLPARRMTITCHKFPSLDIIFTTMKESFALKNYLCQWNEKTRMIFIWKKTVYAEWGTEDLSLIWWHHFHIFLLSFGRQRRRDDPRHRKNFQSFQFQCHAYHSGSLLLYQCNSGPWNIMQYNRGNLTQGKSSYGR